MKGQEERAGDPGLKGSGLPPAVVPDQVPAAARVRTVGQPIVQDGHLIEGELPVVAQPLVLANGGREMDPTNPAGAPRRPPVLVGPAAQKDAQRQLQDMLKLGPGGPGYDPDRLHRLHYEAAGQSCPESTIA